MKWSLKQWSFVVGVLYLVCAVVEYGDRAGGNAGMFHRYSWAMWIVGAAVFFCSPYRAPKVPPH